MTSLKTSITGQWIKKLRLATLLGLIFSSLTGCTAMVVTSALATATKTAVGVAALPVKAAASLVASDDEDAEEEASDDNEDGG